MKRGGKKGNDKRKGEINMHKGARNSIRRGWKNVERENRQEEEKQIEIFLFSRWLTRPLALFHSFASLFLLRPLHSRQKAQRRRVIRNYAVPYDYQGLRRPRRLQEVADDVVQLRCLVLLLLLLLLLSHSPSQALLTRMQISGLKCRSVFPTCVNAHT